MLMKQREYILLNPNPTKMQIVQKNNNADLTWDPSAVKHRIFRHCLAGSRVGMDVDRVESFMSFKEQIP